ncbi:MAG TPA: hypothetical protein VHT05_13705 [Candidatus Elarobacter sp.]|jgi:hypothetical protein|nr:hypothetical protein [Candidatus Elarobacter sp.]
MIRWAPLALASLLAATISPARADDASDAVRAKIAAAMSAAKSFVVTTSAATGMTGSMTFVAPNLYHSAVVFNRARRDVILVGTTGFMSEDDGQTYRKFEPPAEMVSAQAELRAIPVDRLLADKTVGGKVWGQFATSSGGPEKDQQLTCTYDKATFRIGQCSNPGLVMSFSRYDDPSNVVVVPTLVKGTSK